MSEKRKGWFHLFSTKPAYLLNIDPEMLKKRVGEYEGVEYEIAADSDDDDDGLFYVFYHGEGWRFKSDGPFRTLAEAHRRAHITIFQVVVE